MGLRQVFDKIEPHVHSVSSRLGVDFAAYASLLAPVLMKRIPQETALIVSREVKEDSWNLDNVVKIIEREIQARERTTQDANGTARRPSGWGTCYFNCAIDRQFSLSFVLLLQQTSCISSMQNCDLQLSNGSSAYDVWGDALYA